jgi:GntP family gluconate:H+ symporter
MPEYLVFLIMTTVFVVLALAVRLPVGLALCAAAMAGSLISGQGLSLRHMIEGSFGFFDVMLIILTAMVFIKVMEAAGILDSVTAALVRTFYRKKALLLLTAMLLVMFPGMITGSSAAGVLSAGPLVAPVLMKMGLPRLKTAAFIAMGGILGMIAPPVNVLVMIMGGGADIPYVGFTGPLLLICIPTAIFTALWLGMKDVKTISAGEMLSILPRSHFHQYGFRLYLPIILLVLLLAGQQTLARFAPDPGIPAIFLLCSLVGLISGRRFNFFRATLDAVRDALPILTILFGVGMFLQMMTLTGARGWTVMTVLSLPSVFLYAGIALSLPLFGGVSAFGSASILGVPFILALVTRNALFTASALSAIVGLGDLMPPSAIAGRFAAQVSGEKNFFRVLRPCLVPALALLVMGLAVLILAPWLDRIF